MTVQELAIDVLDPYVGDTLATSATCKHARRIGWERKSSLPTGCCTVDNVSSCHCSSYNVNSFSISNLPPPSSSSSFLRLSLPLRHPSSLNLYLLSQSLIARQHTVLNDSLAWCSAVVQAWIRRALEIWPDGKLPLSCSPTNMASHNPGRVIPPSFHGVALGTVGLEYAGGKFGGGDSDTC